MSKMNIRTVNTLYKVIRELYVSYMEDPTRYKSEAICSTIANADVIGLINYKEKWVLLRHFEKEKPSPFKHQDFFYGTNFVNGTFWWNNNKRDETNATRLRFIEKLIKITTQEKFYYENT